jgi:hypothetical protein
MLFIRDEMAVGRSRADSMNTVEKEFRDEIDCCFPYDDFDQCKRLINRGIAISPYASFAVLHEICRPGQSVSVSADRLMQLLEYWRSRFDHPAAEMMREVAHSMILKRYLPVDEVIARMGILAEYPGLSPALEILYFSCDDVGEKLEPLYDGIHKRWADLPQ